MRDREREGPTGRERTSELPQVAGFHVKWPLYKANLSCPGLRKVEDIAFSGGRFFLALWQVKWRSFLPVSFSQEAL